MLILSHTLTKKALRKAIIHSELLTQGLLLIVWLLFTVNAFAASGEVNGLNLASVKEIYDSKSACFVDARSEYSYYQSHIKGARSLSDSRFEEQFPEFRQKISTETPIVVYCISPRCSKAEHVAEKLKKNGYRDVRVFTGGLLEWSAAGYPLEQ
ncbi:MAG: rhodanese-like domain-containing protein [Chlorobium sp.]|nr:MAG: rhodanese-like domain-containing protein [Chlorobium sp.]